MRRIVRAILMAGICLTPAHAQMPLHPPEIRTLFPIGGARGSTVDLLVDGQNVADPRLALVGGEGVRASVLPVIGAGGTVGIVGNSTARVRLEIAPDAPLGIREIRLLTPAGLTNRALFEVGQAMPGVRESEPNDTSAAAQAVTFPTTVDGGIEPGEDVDLFRFRVESGDALLFRVAARSLESSLDACLTLRDAKGRELATNDDFMSRDPALAHRFPRAGEYLIEVRDTDYGGSPEASYRLTISREPALRTVFPLGAARGTVADLTLFGLNLGQRAGRGPDWYMVPNVAPVARYPIAADAPPGPSPFRVTTPGGVSNAIEIETLTVPEVREVEPNDDLTRAARLPVPGVGHGQIDGGKGSPGGDFDLFRFTAAKGVKLRVSIRARAAGSRLDALLTVRECAGTPPAAGKKLGRADDSDGSRDPTLLFDPPADGEYCIEVTDLNGAGGPEHVYMLKVEPVVERPDVSLAIYPANPSVPRGGSVPVEVRVTRRGGFTGAVRFELPPLPAGVTAMIPPYAATAERFYLALNATRDAPAALGPFGLTGIAEIDGKTIERVATGSERVWNLAPLRAVPTTLMGIGVCEASDFTLALEPGEITLAPGESREVTVRVAKIPNYPRGIPIRAATVDYGGGALPAGLSVSRVTLPPEADRVSVSVSAGSGTKPGEYPIFICGLSNPSTNDYILVGYLAPPLVVKVVEKVATVGDGPT